METIWDNLKKIEPFKKEQQFLIYRDKYIQTLKLTDFHIGGCFWVQENLQSKLKTQNSTE